MQKSFLTAAVISAVLAAPLASAQTAAAQFFFTKGSANLMADSADRIPVLANTLKNGNKTKIVVTGHCTTDDLEDGGTAKIAADRAQAVADGLRAHGVSAGISIIADQTCSGSGAFYRFVDVSAP